MAAAATDTARFGSLVVRTRWPAAPGRASTWMGTGARRGFSIRCGARAALVAIPQSPGCRHSTRRTTRRRPRAKSAAFTTWKARPSPAGREVGPRARARQRRASGRSRRAIRRRSLRQNGTSRALDQHDGQRDRPGPADAAVSPASPPPRTASRQAAYPAGGRQREDARERRAPAPSRHSHAGDPAAVGRAAPCGWRRRADLLVRRSALLRSALCQRLRERYRSARVVLEHHQPLVGRSSSGPSSLCVRLRSRRTRPVGSGDAVVARVADHSTSGTHARFL